MRDKKVLSRKRNRMTDEEIIGDDGDREKLCVHGVGHGNNVHTCDGCCSMAKRLAVQHRAKRVRHK